MYKFHKVAFDAVCAQVAEAWLSANPDGEFHCCVDGHSESNNTCSASLAIHIQQGYPTEPLQCHVCSDSLPRPWVDSSTVDLQARADQAATDSLPCLYELLQMLQDKLNDVPATMAQSSTSKDLVSTQSAAAPGPSSDAAPSAGCHACLLQLDHMRNKAAYIKTIKKWATQLGLTGRLIFLRCVPAETVTPSSCIQCSLRSCAAEHIIRPTEQATSYQSLPRASACLLPVLLHRAVCIEHNFNQHAMHTPNDAARACRQLIWIYLEGSKDGLREYITLQRTVSVDVDSKGRKCKERMMDVLCEEQVQQASYSDFR